MVVPLLQSHTDEKRLLQSHSTATTRRRRRRHHQQQQLRHTIHQSSDVDVQQHTERRPQAAAPVSQVAIIDLRSCHGKFYKTSSKGMNSVIPFFHCLPAFLAAVSGSRDRRSERAGCASFVLWIIGWSNNCQSLLLYFVINALDG